MGKENTKSPLKQSPDKRYNRQTYTGMGTTMQDRLIDGAYISARADAPDYSWMKVVGAGVKAFKGEMDIKQAAKDAQREGDLAKIQGITDKIYETGGSLPENYYDQAYDYTEALREKYVAAVESGNNKKATKIKGQINMFATSIGTLKENIIETAELWKDDMLVNSKGMTPEQISINKSIDENNAVINMEDGTFSWRNVDYVEGGEGYLGKEFFTSEDLKGALPLRDDVNKEAHLESNKVILENREKWRDGTGGDFDNKTHRDANIKLIDKSIKDVGSMQSFIWDDITGFGSFADSVEKHPEFENYFSAMNTKDGLPNMVAIGLYDKDKDGVVGYGDFISDEDYIRFEKHDLIDPKTGKKDGVISPEEFEAAFKKDPELEGIIKELVKPKIKNAILHPPKGQEDLTKSLLADFMTNRQSQMFYGNEIIEIGGRKIDKYKTLVPDAIDKDGNDISQVKIKDGLLYIGKDQITDAEDYVKRGGSLGYLDKAGWSWNSEEEKFVHNANWGAITKKTKIDLNE